MKISLEQSILRLFVFFSMGYQFVQLIYDFLFTKYVWITQIENIITILLYMIVLYASRKSPEHYINAMWVLLIATASLVFEWLFFGGFESSMPYEAILIIMVIIICTSGKQRVWTTSLFFLLILALLFQDYVLEFPFDTAEIHPSNLTLSLDFLLHGLLITLLTLTLKQKFDHYRMQIVNNNKALKKIDSEIALKNNDLARQQAKIQSLNTNLEKMIDQEVRLIKEKNDKLAAYAYINAHHLRGPLCRIMGLADLMEETTPDDPYLAHSLKKRAEALDEIIKQINQTVS